MNTENRGQFGGPVLSEARLGWDSADQWGTTMGWLFACADVLHVAGEAVPAEWEYEPGAGLSREGVEESYPDSLLLELLDDDVISADDIRYAGKVLQRYRAQLKLAGQDY